MHLRVFILSSVALVSTTLALPSPTLHTPNQSLNKRTVPDPPIYQKIIALEKYCKVHDPELRTQRCNGLYEMRGQLVGELFYWFSPYLHGQKEPPRGDQELELFQHRHELLVKYFLEADPRMLRQGKKEAFDRWGLVFNPTPPDGLYLSVLEAEVGQAAIAFTSSYMLQQEELIPVTAQAVLLMLAHWFNYVLISAPHSNPASLMQHLDLGKEALGHTWVEILKIEAASKARLRDWAALESPSAIVKGYLDYWFVMHSRKLLPDNFKAHFRYNQELWVKNYRRYLASFEPTVEKKVAYTKCLVNARAQLPGLGNDLNEIEAEIRRNIMVKCSIPIIRWDTLEAREDFARAAEERLSGARERWHHQRGDKIL